MKKPEMTFSVAGENNVAHTSLKFQVGISLWDSWLSFAPLSFSKPQTFFPCLVFFVGEENI